MTMTKRQKFIHRIKQSINLLDRVHDYILEIHAHVINSKYEKRVNKYVNKLFKLKEKLQSFLDEVDTIKKV